MLVPTCATSESRAFISSRNPSSPSRIGPVSGVADPEGVQMIILPAHSGLDHLVQPAQRKRRRDKHAPPLAGLTRPAPRSSPRRETPPPPARPAPPPPPTPPRPGRPPPPPPP